MSGISTLRAGLGTLTVIGCAIGGTIAPAAAHITVLDDDAATIARAIAPREDGGSGLRLDDDLNQLPTKPAVLPRSRQAARVTASSLLGRDARGMAEILRGRALHAGAHRVFVDDIGPAFAGQEGDDLAAALAILSKERPKYAPTSLARKVHLYVSTPGLLLTDPTWAGARAAISRAGGVWLKTFGDASTWTPAQWLAWPAETAAHLTASGSTASRLHVVFTGDGSQAATWALARTGGTCALLANGPGGYRLGADVDTFVAEYRRTLPIRSKTKGSTLGCTSAPSLTGAGARVLAAAFALEATGLEIPPGGLITPPLHVGEPAQLTLQLGADPLGLAAAFGLSPEAFWTAAQARLETRGPGIATDATIEGDGTARLEFTPAEPGPVTMRLVIDQAAITRAIGAEADLVASLRSAGVEATVIQRLVTDPSGWRLTIPLVQPGGAPGSPVLEIPPLPIPAPAPIPIVPIDLGVVLPLDDLTPAIAPEPAAAN